MTIKNNIDATGRGDIQRRLVNQEPFAQRKRHVVNLKRKENGRREGGANIQLTSKAAHQETNPPYPKHTHTHKHSQTFTNTHRHSQTLTHSPSLAQTAECGGEKTVT